MFRENGRWYSEFPPVRGVAKEVKYNEGIIAVTSYGGMTGGHAALYLEHIDDYGNACVYKIHLTAGLGGSGKLESTGSGSSASGSGTNEVYINFEPKEVNEESRDRGTTLHYQSFVVTNEKIYAVVAAVSRFEAKVARGRYTYRLAGGTLGWLTTRPGKRGVNCADFCIKILKEAGIADLGSKFINTPKRVAGG
jgi:hypothetical protein